MPDKQLKDICKINMCEYRFFRDDKKSEKERKNFVFPPFDELLHKARQAIKELGFDEINHVKPSSANCIIRVFMKKDYIYECSEKHNIYGFACFIKNKGKWVSYSESGSTYEIDFSKFIFRFWFFQDEYVDYDCDFMDCYLKVE